RRRLRLFGSLRHRLPGRFYTHSVRGRPSGHGHHEEGHRAEGFRVRHGFPSSRIAERTAIWKHEDSCPDQLTPERFGAPTRNGPAPAPARITHAFTDGFRL